MHKYDELTERLLQQESIEGIPTDVHQRFRQTYGTSLYTCRVKKCPRAVHGFTTLPARDKHEQDHAQNFRCSYPQCFGHRSGIGSAKKLKDHMQQYHPEPPRNSALATHFGKVRSDTETTLVNPDGEEEGSKNQEIYSEAFSNTDSEETDEELYGINLFKEIVRSDRFALGTISL